MDALEAAKRFEQSPDNVGNTMRKMLKEGFSDEAILTGLSMAAGFLPKTAVA